MDKFIADFIQMQKIKEEEMNKILSNYEYINWIINFSKDIDSFTEYNWLYDSLELSEIDKENIKRLGLFYEAIDKYARANFIYPIVTNNESYYQIKIDNYGFEIGIINGQDNIHFCQRAHIEKNEFIDFKDILTNKKQDNVNEIINKLNALGEMIQKTYNEGVPLEAINNTVNKTLNELSWQAKNKSLIKKMRNN